MSTNVHLTPELEAFAKSCVAEGRYNNVSEVVRSSLRLLQDQEDRRRAFDKMIAEVRRETDEKGARPADEVIQRLRDMVADGKK